MLRTNSQHLVEQAVAGVISNPKINLKNPYLIDGAGNVQVLPGTGGITYNVTVGDSALDYQGDHIEPGVSLCADGRGADSAEAGGLNVLSCIGNTAVIMSGAASASKGTVTGKHGGINHVLVDFPLSTIENLAIGDRIQIRSFGQGLQLKDYLEIQVMNIDPGLLFKFGITSQKGQLVVPVTHVIPSSVMGSGIGSRHSFSGDYDIQLSEKDTVQRHGLQNLRIGDVIAIQDADCRFGRAVRSGAITIGIVVHASCVTGGHGPGVTVIMTTAKKLMVPRIEENANIAFYLEIGHGRRRTTRTRRRRSGPSRR